MKYIKFSNKIAIQLLTISLVFIGSLTVATAAPGGDSGGAAEKEKKADSSVKTKSSKDKDKTPSPLLTADQYVEKIQSFYNSTKDYQATFVQSYNDIAAGTTSTAKGKVYIKQPGKMRWDYYKDGKREKLYVSNGKDFWAYEFAFKQAFKQCLKGSQLKTSLSFLMGGGDLGKEFTVRLAKKSTAEEPILRLKPKEATSKFKELEFKINPENGQVLQTVIYDPYGNSNTIRFLNVKLNGDLPDNGFEFTPPKGTRVLNPDQKCE